MSSQSSPVASAAPLEPFDQPDRGPSDDAVIPDPPPPYSATASDLPTPDSQGGSPKDASNSEGKDQDTKKEEFARREEEARAHYQKEHDLRMQEFELCQAEAKESGRVESAWAAYEKAWAALPDKASEAPLRWADIPWPMINAPSRADGLVSGSIANLILSPRHSLGKSPRERQADALLRCHPDRFESRWLPKCAENEREEIKNGAGFVVRCLNELLSVQSALVAS